MGEIRPQLIERFGYSSSIQTPRFEKVTLNMGVGDAKQDSKALKAAQDQLATIAGQQPSVRRARKSIAAFKLREGMPVGVSVTLRRERSYQSLDRLISIAIPRIRDFRGLRARSFDGRGNYSMGVREQIIFPEIDYDTIDHVRGLDITITTSARTDVEAFALLSALGMPFSTYGRPAEFAQVLGESADSAGSESADSASETPAPLPRRALALTAPTRRAPTQPTRRALTLQPRRVPIPPTRRALTAPTWRAPTQPTRRALTAPARRASTPPTRRAPPTRRRQTDG